MVIRWGNFGEEMEVNKDALPEIWLEEHESITHGPWMSIDWETQAVEILEVKGGWACLLAFNLRYSWYSSSKNLASTLLNLDAVLLGKPNKWKHVIQVCPILLQNVHSVWSPLLIVYKWSNQTAARRTRWWLNQDRRGRACYQAYPNSNKRTWKRRTNDWIRTGRGLQT